MLDWIDTSVGNKRYSLYQYPDTGMTGFDVIKKWDGFTVFWGNKELGTFKKLSQAKYHAESVFLVNSTIIDRHLGDRVEFTKETGEIVEGEIIEIMVTRDWAFTVRADNGETYHLSVSEPRTARG